MAAKLDGEVRSIGRGSRTAIRRTTLAKVSSFYSKARFQEAESLAPVAVTKRCEVADRLLTVFRRYEDDIVQQYFWSRDYAQDFMCLCQYMKTVLSKEKAFFKLKGPVHVFGDIHGNLEDLFFFREKLWPAGMDVTAGKFLFLGDYVDRGMKGLEVLTYLFAAKVCSPHKLFMLRGNHELRYVNGWESHYKERSFLWQCKNRFGAKLGAKVWRAANSVFDYLPLACSIDESVFCSHGGIPRFNLSASAGWSGKPRDTRLDDIAGIALPARISPARIGQDADDVDEEEEGPTPQDNLFPWQTSLAMDLMWGDPCPSNPGGGADGDQESRLLDDRGFGPGQRGGAAIMFGQRAVDEFFGNNNFSVMIRAHQANSAGVAVTKNGKVVTVFSTSKDHALGENCTCAYLLVEDLRVTAVNRAIDHLTHVRLDHDAATPRFATHIPSGVSAASKNGQPSSPKPVAQFGLQARALSKGASQAA